MPRFLLYVMPPVGALLQSVPVPAVAQGAFDPHVWLNWGAMGVFAWVLLHLLREERAKASSDIREERKAASEDREKSEERLSKLIEKYEAIATRIREAIEENSEQLGAVKNELSRTHYPVRALGKDSH